MPLSDLFGERARDWNRRMAEAPTVQEQAAVTDGFWRDLRDERPDRFAQAPTPATVAAERVVSDHSILTVVTAASAARMSVRSLEWLLRHPRDASGQIALDLGYFDQAHFIRDFKAVVGVPPEVYRQRQKPATVSRP